MNSEDLIKSIIHKYQNPYGGSTRIHTVVVPESIRYHSQNPYGGGRPESIRWGSPIFKIDDTKLGNVYDDTFLEIELSILGNFRREFCLKK